MTSDRIFYENGRGAVAVSLDEILVGKLIAPNGRILPVTQPWVESDTDDLPLTAEQEETVRVLEAQITEMREAWAQASRHQTEWEAFIDALIDPINARVGRRLL